MAKPRKLKVFRTPIGFHDAYVAVPTQKAALEAWGTDTNLFARGMAEQVTDEELMDVPLKRPGEVIKVLRGTKAEQIAALGQAVKAKAKAKSGSPVKSGMPKKKAPKPSRARLAKADEAIEALARQHEKEMKQIDKAADALARKRRELERRQERQRDEAAEKAERERTRYERDMREWEDY